MASFNDDEKPRPIIDEGAERDQGRVKMSYDPPRKPYPLTGCTVTAMLEVGATRSAAGRKPLDLVAVVDVSGSMAEHKIESVKKALQFVIMKLTPVDRLSIVTFNTSARRLSGLRSMTEDAQSELKDIVGAVTASGGTDITKGLQMGLDVLRGRVYTDSRTANIFLMSDGEHTEYSTSGDPRQVDSGKVPVFTIGFGSATDHKLLTDLAKKSPGGTFSIVPDNTCASGSFSMLLAGVLTVVARDVKVRIDLILKDGQSEHVEKMVVVGTQYYTQTTDDATKTTTVAFGEIFSWEKRRVIISFTLKNVSGGPNDTDDGYDENDPIPINQQLAPLDIANATHSYEGEETGGQLTIPISIYRTKNAPPVTTTTTCGGGGGGAAVQAELVRLQHADLIRKASALADAQMLDRAREKLMDAQNAVEDIMLDDGDRMANALRAELRQLFRYMESQKLYDALGRPYALATLISHDQQRAAGRGDEAEVASLYTTPRMEAYIEQAKKFEENPLAPVPSADDDVSQEMAADPFSAISDPLDFYIGNAIKALQAIQKIVSSTRTT